jgi:hypothetical protein
MKLRKYNEYKDEESYEDDIENLLYLLRTYFKKSGIDAVVKNKELDINIQVSVNRVEKLETIVKIFEVAKKVRKDMLGEYDSEMDIWSYKTGDTTIEFFFYYDEGDGDDSAPF